jgi:hypothetical protein
VIKVAFLVSVEVRPKELSSWIDSMFMDTPEIRQFVVEGCGIDDVDKATEEVLMAAAMAG